MEMYYPRGSVRTSVWTSIALVATFVVAMCSWVGLVKALYPKGEEVSGDVLRIFFGTFYLVGGFFALIGAVLIFMRARFRWVFLCTIIALLGSGVYLGVVTCMTPVAVMALIFLLIGYDEIVTAALNTHRRRIRCRHYDGEDDDED